MADKTGAQHWRAFGALEQRISDWLDTRCAEYLCETTSACLALELIWVGEVGIWRRGSTELVVSQSVTSTTSNGVYYIATQLVQMESGQHVKQD